MKIEVNDSDGVVSGNVYIGDTDVPTEFLDADSTTVCDTLKSDISPHIGLLSPAVRWISADKRLVAFERPPCIQKVDIIPMFKDAITSKMSSNDAYRMSYNLPIPWTVYLVQFDAEFNPIKVRVFTRPSSLESLDDEVYLLPLLNLYYNGAICNPNHSVYEHRKPSLALGVQEAYNLMWNSGFNMDLKDAIVEGIRQHSPVKARTMIDISNNRIFDFFERWSRLHIEDVLNAYWAPVSFYDDTYHEDESAPSHAHNDDGEPMFNEDGEPLMIEEWHSAPPKNKTLQQIINWVSYNELLMPEPTPNAMMIRMTNVIMASAIL